MKRLFPAAATATAVLIAGPALAVDYVQCNAMRVAYDREIAEFVNQRMMRNQTGERDVIQRCGLPPDAGASETERTTWESCKLPAYEAGVQRWDKQNGQIDQKTGKTTVSRFALNAIKIIHDMSKNKCPF